MSCPKREIQVLRFPSYKLFRRQKPNQPSAPPLPPSPVARPSSQIVTQHELCVLIKDFSRFGNRTPIFSSDATRSFNFSRRNWIRNISCRCLGLREAASLLSWQRASSQH